MRAPVRGTPRGVWVAVALLACVAPASGCATSWAVSEITTGEAPLRDGVRVETVPVPGVKERLQIGLKLVMTVPTPAADPASAAPASAAAGEPARPHTPGLRVSCAVTQTGRDTTYTAATEYGPTFKKFAAAFMLLEGAGAALFLLGKQPLADRIVFGGFLTVDALGSGLLLLVPKRDHYDKIERETTIPIRNECPPGLTIDLDGQPVAVGPAGDIDDDGQRLFEQHMVRSPLPLRVHVGDRAADAFVDRNDRCLWARRRQHEALPAICAGADTTAGREEVTVGFDVWPGTLLGPWPRVARREASAAPAPP